MGYNLVEFLEKETDIESKAIKWVSTCHFPRVQRPDCQGGDCFDQKIRKEAYVNNVVWKDLLLLIIMVFVIPLGFQRSNPPLC